MASSLIARLSARGVRGRLPIATAATTAIAARRLLSQQGKADYSEAGTSQSQSGNTFRHLVLASGCFGLAAAASSLLIPNHELAHKQTQQEEEPNSSSKVTTVDQEAEERRRKLQAFASWLRESGADVEGLCFEEVPEMESEVGLFSKRRVPALGRAQRWAARVATLGFGGREHPVARIPLAGVALTPATPLRDENPDVAALFESSLSSGDLDPREAVVLYLILEHRRGEKSKWQRYLDVLPTQPAPLLSASDLSDLRGTTLYRAATSFRRRLPERFREDLCPLLDKILDLAGLGGARDRVSYPEFARFYSAFWSRAIALPLRAPSETGEETFFQADCLVPGLDFANHSGRGANARWQVDGNVVKILATSALGPGEEIRISYGERGNEELMFQYGFCEDGNARDALLVDLGALGREARAGSREEAEFQARAERAQQLGVSLRCFLPASGVDWAEGKARGLPSEFVGALELMVGGSDVGAEPSFGALTLATKLLQAACFTLESEDEGTGTLEEDLRLIERGGLEDLQRSCVVYRAGQKKIARAYLKLAQGELSKRMKGPR